MKRSGLRVREVKWPGYANRTWRSGGGQPWEKRWSCSFNVSAPSYASLALGGLVAEDGSNMGEVRLNMSSRCAVDLGSGLSGEGGADSSAWC